MAVETTSRDSDSDLTVEGAVEEQVVSLVDEAYERASIDGDISLLGPREYGHPEDDAIGYIIVKQPALLIDVLTHIRESERYSADVRKRGLAHLFGLGS